MSVLLCVIDKEPVVNFFYCGGLVFESSFSSHASMDYPEFGFFRDPFGNYLIGDKNNVV